MSDTWSQGGEGGPREAGGLLRKARIDRGLSLEEIAQSTRVPKVHLEAIERGDMAALPPGPFAKGFVTSYARQVGVDPEVVGNLIDGAPRYTPQEAQGSAPGVPEGEPEGRKSKSTTRRGVALVLALVLFGVVGLLLRSNSEDPAPEPTPPSLVLEEGQDGPIPEKSTTQHLGTLPEAEGVAFEVFTDSARGDSPHVVVLKARHRSYIRVSESLEGEPLHEAILEAGESETFSSAEGLWIVLGNGGAVDLTYLGGAIKGLGPDGDRIGLAFRGP